MKPSRKKLRDENQFVDRDGETKRQILKAAEELFLAKGFKGVSMKDVAEAVEVTSAALYYHFPGGKQDLFVSMIQEMFEEWNRGLFLVVTPDQTLREKLTSLTKYLFTLPFDRMPMLMRDMHEQVIDHQTRRQMMMQKQFELLQWLSRIFQSAIDAGEITDTVPAHVLATMYEGMSISLLRSKHLAMGGAEQLDVDVLARQVASVLLDGIGKKTAQTG